MTSNPLHDAIDYLKDTEELPYYDSLKNKYFDNLEVYLDELGLCIEEREELKQILIKENKL